MLVIRGRPRIDPRPYVLDAALAHVVDTSDTAAGRHKVEFAFKIRAGTLSSNRSELAKELRRRVKTGALVEEADGTLRIPLDANLALETLRDLGLPAAFFDTVSKRFMKAHEAARIRQYVATREWQPKRNA